MSRTSHYNPVGNLDLTSAVERGTAALSTAKERLLPVALDARERIIPLALDAKQHIVPLALDAKDHLPPLAAEAVDRVAPLMQGAAAKAQEAAAKARPVVTTAVTRVTEVVGTEVKPRLADLLDEAQRDQRLSEATKRGRAAVAALRGDLPMPEDEEPAPQSKHHPVLKALGIALLIGIGIAILRTLFSARDDDWELDDEADDLPADAAHDDSSEPTEPIQPGRRAEVDDEPAAELTPAEPETAAPEPAPAVAAEPEPEPAPDQPSAEEDQGDPFRYGEGSFIGTTPPEGYTIKGNERSMKYHVPGALAYERCSTQVWFNSTQAAERAGFVRAER